jgi:LDH2 family malate/lactate/ureidoglycolate dehydrogenase
MERMKNEIRITHSDLITAIRKALEYIGVPAHIANVEAEVMAESDLMGVASHGIRMLPGLITGIREGRSSANPNIRIVRDFNAICVLDGDNGPGRFICVEAMTHAIERAKKFGIGTCLAKNVTHWGRGFAYAFRAAQAGTIGICMTNAITNMVAWGSSQPLLGNNPIAIGVPRKGKNPVVLDMAMSQAAIGKMVTYLREGKSTPLGWGLDGEGRPTTDPRAMLTSKRILPFGEHKGAGLAIMMELLTGALSGSMLSYEIGEADPSGLDPNSSKLFIAIDVQAIGDIESLSASIEKMYQWMHKTEPTIDIFYPGDQSWKNRETNLREGIPIRPDILKDLKKVNVIL